MNYFVFVVLALCLVTSNAFLAPTPPSAVTKSTALEMTVLTYKGKKRDFKAGSPLKNACSALGVKPKYSCKQ